MSKILTFGEYALTVGNHAVGASVVNPYVPTLYKINYLSTAGYFRTEPTPKSAYGGDTVTVDVSDMYEGYYVNSYRLYCSGHELPQSYYVSYDPPVFKMPNSAVTVEFDIGK